MNSVSNMQPKLACLFMVLVIIPLQTFSQELPESGVWLARIADGIPGKPRLISQSGGYNNQPMFSADGREIYFTAERDPGQTDVVRFVIENNTLEWVNHSPESEYSPTPVPGNDAVSVIRVELPNQRQRLWSISLSGGAAELLLPNVESVGYHSWIDRNTVALFILGDSFTLHTAAIGDQPSKLVFDHIGRTIRRHPGTGEVLFVDKNSEPWSIASLDPGSGTREELMPLFPGVEDFEVDPDGHFWMGSGSKLYSSNQANAPWNLKADLRAWGVKNISRLAVSPGGHLIAIVSGR